MPVQTSYSLNPPAGINGLVTRFGNIIDSKLASGIVPVGMLCTWGANSLTAPSLLGTAANGHSAGQCLAFPAAVADNPLLETEFIGIPIYDATRMSGTTFGSGAGLVSAYADQETVPILRKGWIWVATDSAVVQGRLVTVRTTAAGGFNLGQLSGTADGSHMTWSRGVWQMTTAAAGLAIVEVW